MYAVLELLELARQAQGTSTQLHRLLDREILHDDVSNDTLLQRTLDEEMLFLLDQAAAACVAWCKAKFVTVMVCHHKPRKFAHSPLLFAQFKSPL